METTLHRQLKERFLHPGSEIEVNVQRYRIDVVTDGRLIEIQHSGLAAIRDKIRDLLKNDYLVEVVKPLIARKRLIKLSGENGKVVQRRWSPRRGTMLDLFDELLYFTRVFPHPRLRLTCPLVEIEEQRFPGHGRRRRRRAGDFVVKDRFLVQVIDTQCFQTAQDLHRILPNNLPEPFDTRQLSDGLRIERWQAQRIAYVLRHTGSVKHVGKRGNTNLFQLCKVNSPKNKRNSKQSKRKSRTAA
jgi:hypothetical protein